MRLKIDSELDLLANIKLGIDTSRAPKWAWSNYESALNGRIRPDLRNLTGSLGS
jgi:hypothetical protein